MNRVGHHVTRDSGCLSVIAGPETPKLHSLDLEHELPRHRNRPCSAPIFSQQRITALSGRSCVSELAVVAFASSVQDQLECPGNIKAGRPAGNKSGFGDTEEVTVSYYTIQYS